MDNLFNQTSLPCKFRMLFQHNNKSFSAAHGSTFYVFKSQQFLFCLRNEILFVLSIIILGTITVLNISSLDL